MLQRANKAIEEASAIRSDVQAQIALHQKLQFGMFKAGHFQALPLRFQEAYKSLRVSLSDEHVRTDFSADAFQSLVQNINDEQPFER